SAHAPGLRARPGSAPGNTAPDSPAPPPGGGARCDTGPYRKRVPPPPAPARAASAAATSRQSPDARSRHRLRQRHAARYLVALVTPQVLRRTFSHHALDLAVDGGTARRQITLDHLLRRTRTHHPALARHAFGPAQQHAG